MKKIIINSAITLSMAALLMLGGNATEFAGLMALIISILSLVGLIANIDDQKTISDMDSRSSARILVSIAVDLTLVAALVYQGYIKTAVLVCLIMILWLAFFVYSKDKMRKKEASA